MGQLGITSGCQPGLFCPSGLLDRSQMAVFVVRSLLTSSANLVCFSPDPAWNSNPKKCEVTSEIQVCPSGLPYCNCSESIPYFQDVPSNHQFFQFIQKQRNLTATCGTSTSPPLFSPDGSVSALAAAIMTARANQLKPCQPSFSTCSGTVNDSATDFSQEAYFPSDLPPVAYGFNFAQKAKDTGAIRNWVW